MGGACLGSGFLGHHQCGHGPSIRVSKPLAKYQPYSSPTRILIIAMILYMFQQD